MSQTSLRQPGIFCRHAFAVSGPVSFWVRGGVSGPTKCLSGDSPRRLWTGPFRKSAERRAGMRAATTNVRNGKCPDFLGTRGLAVANLYVRRAGRGKPRTGTANGRIAETAGRDKHKPFFGACAPSRRTVPRKDADTVGTGPGGPGPQSLDGSNASGSACLLGVRAAAGPVLVFKPVSGGPRSVAAVSTAFACRIPFESHELGPNGVGPSQAVAPHPRLAKNPGGPRSVAAGCTAFACRVSLESRGLGPNGVRPSRSAGISHPDAALRLSNGRRLSAVGRRLPREPHPPPSAPTAAQSRKTSFMAKRPARPGGKDKNRDFLFHFLLLFFGPALFDTRRNLPGPIEGLSGGIQMDEPVHLAPIHVIHPHKRHSDKTPGNFPRKPHFRCLSIAFACHRRPSKNHEPPPCQRQCRQESPPLAVAVAVSEFLPPPEEGGTQRPGVGAEESVARPPPVLSPLRRPAPPPACHGPAPVLSSRP